MRWTKHPFKLSQYFLSVLFLFSLTHLCWADDADSVSFGTGLHSINLPLDQLKGGRVLYAESIVILLSDKTSLTVDLVDLEKLGYQKLSPSKFSNLLCGIERAETAKELTERERLDIAGARDAAITARTDAKTGNVTLKGGTGCYSSASDQSIALLTKNKEKNLITRITATGFSKERFIKVITEATINGK